MLIKDYVASLGLSETLVDGFTLQQVDTVEMLESMITISKLWSAGDDMGIWKFLFQFFKVPMGAGYRLMEDLKTPEHDEGQATDETDRASLGITRDGPSGSPVCQA